MPLIKSGSKAAVGKNISKEMAAGRPQKQAVSIALSVHRKYGSNMSMHEGGLVHHPVHDCGDGDGLIHEYSDDDLVVRDHGVIK